MRLLTRVFLAYLILINSTFAAIKADICSLGATCTIYNQSTTSFTIYANSGGAYVCRLEQQMPPMKIAIKGEGDFVIDIGAGEFTIDPEDTIYIYGHFDHPNQMLPGMLSFEGLSGLGTVKCVTVGM